MEHNGKKVIGFKAKINIPYFHIHTHCGDNSVYQKTIVCEISKGSIHPIEFLIYIYGEDSVKELLGAIELIYLSEN